MPASEGNWLNRVIKGVDYYVDLYNKGYESYPGLKIVYPEDSRRVRRMRAFIKRHYNDECNAILASDHWDRCDNMYSYKYVNVRDIRAEYNKETKNDAAIVLLEFTHWKRELSLRAADEINKYYVSLVDRAEKQLFNSENQERHTPKQLRLLTLQSLLQLNEKDVTIVVRPIDRKCMTHVAQTVKNDYIAINKTPINIVVSEQGLGPNSGGGLIIASNSSFIFTNNTVFIRFKYLEMRFGQVFRTCLPGKSLKEREHPITPLNVVLEEMSELSYPETSHRFTVMINSEVTPVKLPDFTLKVTRHISINLDWKTKRSMMREYKKYVKTVREREHYRQLRAAVERKRQWE